MIPCPKIATFQRVNGPRIAEWLARYVTTIVEPQGKTRLDFLPIVFQAPSEAEAIKCAEEWWATEQAKEAEKAKRAAAFGEIRRSRK